MLRWKRSGKGFRFHKLGEMHTLRKDVRHLRNTKIMNALQDNSACRAFFAIELFYGDIKGRFRQSVLDSSLNILNRR